MNLLITIILLMTAPIVKSDEAKINKVSFLGIPILSANLDDVRSQLWSIGGFNQARSTKQKRAIDKFFPSYRLQDSYYIEFRYLSSGNLFSAKRQYRPQSTHFQNKQTPISTRAVAAELSQSLGPPTSMRTPSTASAENYSAFIWETDKVKITVDRKGSEIFGDVFVLYEVKTDPYFVAKVDPGANLNPAR